MADFGCELIIVFLEKILWTCYGGFKCNNFLSFILHNIHVPLSLDLQSLAQLITGNLGFTHQ